MDALEVPESRTLHTSVQMGVLYSDSPYSVQMGVLYIEEVYDRDRNEQTTREQKCYPSKGPCRIVDRQGGERKDVC